VLRDLRKRVNNHDTTKWLLRVRRCKFIWKRLLQLLRVEWWDLLHQMLMTCSLAFQQAAVCHDPCFARHRNR
jgi:hypothetical protein